jgi:hypothetical protein
MRWQIQRQIRIVNVNLRMFGPPVRSRSKVMVVVPEKCGGELEILEAITVRGLPAEFIPKALQIAVRPRGIFHSISRGRPALKIRGKAFPFAGYVHVVEWDPLIEVSLP